MLTNLFIQILNMSYNASIVIVFVLMLRLFLKKSPKIFSYILWGAVLFRLVSPFSLESFVSLIPVNLSPIESTIVYDKTPTVNTGIAILNTAINRSLPAPTPINSVNPLQIGLMIAATIWLVGVIVMLTYNLVSYIKLRLKLKNAQHVRDSIYSLEGLNTAFVMGFVRPKIYLPEALSREEKDYIILHEQVHIKRYDPQLKLVSFILLCLHWFNPLVWIAFIYSNRDREMSCDEAVIKQLGKSAKKDYSSTLLALTTGKQRTLCIPLAFSEGDTKSRIKNILNYRSPNFWRLLITLSILVVFAVTFMTNPIKRSHLLDVDSAYVSIEHFENAVYASLIAGSAGETVTLSNTQEVITLLTSLEVQQKELSQNRGSDRAKHHQVHLVYKGFSKDAALMDLYFNFSNNYEEVWIDNGIKPSFTYKVIRPSDVKSFFDEHMLNTKNKNNPVTAEALWNARTPYLGDNSAVGNLLSLMALPNNLVHNGFKLYTSGNERGLEWNLNQTDSAGYYEATLQHDAILLLATIENLEYVLFEVTAPSGETTSYRYDLNWALNSVGIDVKAYASSSDTLQELIDLCAARIPIIRYTLAKLGPSGTVIEEIPQNAPGIADTMVFNFMVKSSAYEGIDVTTLPNSYRIRQIFPQIGEVHDFYVYTLEDGTPVVQSGEQGYYNSLEPVELYAHLESLFVK